MQGISQLFLILLQTAETKVFHSELADVRNELEPWEKQLIEHRGKLEVASAEKNLLIKKVSLVIWSVPYVY